MARRWIAEGHEVYGLVRTPPAAEVLAREAVRPVVADVARPSSLPTLPAAETMLYAVGHDPGGGTSPQAVYAGGLRAVLDAAPPEVCRVILISSTGVYAEEAGDWVDESSPCRPARESGRALLAAEEVLAGHRLGPAGIVLRLAGLYGPERLPRRADVVSAAPLPVAAGEYVNLIHVEDAAAAVVAAEARGRPPRTYVVADGHPVERREYLKEMARQLGLPPPSFRDPLPGESPRRRGGNKRANNARMLAELGVTLLYPTYREGLAAAVR